MEPTTTLCQRVHGLDVSSGSREPQGSPKLGVHLQPDVEHMPQQTGGKQALQALLATHIIQTATSQAIQGRCKSLVMILEIHTVTARPLPTDGMHACQEQC
jgi:hypothetical protein